MIKLPVAIKLAALLFVGAAQTGCPIEHPGYYVDHNATTDTSEGEASGGRADLDLPDTSSDDSNGGSAGGFGGAQD